MTQLVSTMRVEIVKPLSGTWDDLGRMLCALRAPIHRVLNGVVTDLEVNERAGRYAKGNGYGPGGKDLHPRTDSYRLACDLWSVERDAARARVEAGKSISMDAAIADIKPGSQVENGLAHESYTRWKKWRLEKWKGTMSLPSFRKDAPIFIASSEAVRIESHAGRTILNVRLVAGAAGPRTRLVVRPYGGRDHGSMRQILDEPERLGCCKIVKKKGRDGKRKWTALITWKRDVPVHDGTRTMAVHRGVTTLLTVAIAGDGKREAWAKILDNGEDIRRHKDIYQKRRRSLGRHGRQLGDGAKGHGTARRHERITRLEDKEARWIDTRCKQAAARVVKLAVSRGVGRILVEDWTNPAKDGAPELGKWMERVVRTFPLAQLRASIEWTAAREGVEVVTVPGAYQSRACPRCQHVHDEPPLDARRIFLCAECSWERNVEVVAVLNMLRVDGQRPATDDLNRAAKRAAGRLRGKRA